VTPRGSTARAAFESAQAVLARHRSADPGLRPAVDMVTPAGPPPGSTAQNGARRAEPSLPASPASPAGWSIAGASRALREGRLHPRDLVEEALAAVARDNGALNALVEVDAGGARAAADRCAAEIAAGRRHGPLHGIPLTVKDVIHVAGMPTRAGSLAYHELPTRDATAVARVRDAGAVLLGKATTHEFALGVTTPQARNPHDPSRIPGGSSGGSAIAVSTGMGLGSIGTDTRASLRIPAALTGVVGFKPTYGAVPTEGVVTLSWTMDHVGPIAGSVTDAALLLDVLTGDAGGLATWAGADPGRLRIGVPSATLEGMDAIVAVAVERAIGCAAALGHTVAATDLVDAGDLETANAAGMVVSRCEAATLHRALGLDRSLYWDEVREQLDEAARLSALDYLDAQRLRSALTTRMHAAFATVDVLAMPTSPVVAPPLEDFALHLLVLSRNAVPWSLVGFPALSLPCTAPDDALPAGLQLVAPPGGEGVLVAVGTALERALAAT
jgi:aspartyl-tRNA(Asn)/glutamyl-tRNA(Gln) amidotransferase subunit A